jgi:hypothetical protein
MAGSCEVRYSGLMDTLALVRRAFEFTAAAKQTYHILHMVMLSHMRGDAQPHACMYRRCSHYSSRQGHVHLCGSAFRLDGH